MKSIILSLCVLIGLLLLPQTGLTQPGQMPDLKLSIDGPRTAYVNRSVVYKIIVKNDGEAPAIVVVLWDVGGGNFFAPTAKILVDVFGTNAAEIRLFSVDSDGATTELQSFACGNGSRINFNTKYNRGQTQSFEIRLYDGKGNLLTSSKRKVG